MCVFFMLVVFSFPIIFGTTIVSESFHFNSSIEVHRFIYCFYIYLMFNVGISDNLCIYVIVRCAMLIDFYCSEYEWFNFCVHIQLYFWNGLLYFPLNHILFLDNLHSIHYSANYSFFFIFFLIHSDCMFLYHDSSSWFFFYYG